MLCHYLNRCRKALDKNEQPFLIKKIKNKTIWYRINISQHKKTTLDTSIPHHT